MTALFSLSADGLSFIHQCPHCGTERREPVNPAVNPDPFSYLPCCSGCGHRIDIDSAFITGVQASFQRARALIPGKKNPASASTPAGIKGGDLQSGSPEYLVFNRTSTELVAGAGLEPATSWL